MEAAHEAGSDFIEGRMSPWASQEEVRALTTRLGIAPRPHTARREYSKRTMNYANPWGLSPQVERSMQAVIETGTEADAAELLGVTVKVIQGRMRMARGRMGAPNRLLGLLEYDRWKRGQE